MVDQRKREGSDPNCVHNYTYTYVYSGDVLQGESEGIDRRCIKCGEKNRRFLMETRKENLEAIYNLMSDGFPIIRIKLKKTADCERTSMEAYRKILNANSLKNKHRRDKENEKT